MIVMGLVIKRKSAFNLGMPIKYGR